MDSIICQKCGNEAYIDGDPSEYFAWCDECNDYAEGFDVLEYNQERYADMIDRAGDIEAGK